MAASYIDAVWNGAEFWRWNYGEAVGAPASVTYSFANAIPSYYYDDGMLTLIHGGFSAFNADQRAAAQAVLATYAEIAHLTFTQVADGEGGDITFGMNTQGSSAGYAFYGSPFAGSYGDVWISNNPSNNVYATNLNVTPGTYGYLTLVHEIGHTMGLKHTFQTEGPAEEGGSQVTLDLAHDSYRYSVMSYTHQSNELFMRVLNPGTPSEDLQYFRVYPEGPQLYDIAALQYAYGANTATRSGNDTYSFDPDEPFFQCIWDGGGKDTISVATFTLGCRVDLREGAFSDIMIPSDAIPPGWTATTPTYDGKNNLSIAFGAKIENAIGGSGNDTLAGNNLANTLTGNAGADKMTGAGGADTFRGGAGKDTMTGAGGADKFVFDTLDAAVDTVKDFVPGTDKIQLDNAVLAAVGADGALASAGFWLAANAHDGSDRILYSINTGALYYDADGTGPQAKVQLAVLTGSPDGVTVGDFVVI